MEKAKVFMERWARKEPRAVGAFRRLIRQAFTFMKLPRTVVKRASGQVERMAREFRRKYKQMEAFRSSRYVAPTILAWAVRQTAKGDPGWTRRLLRHALSARCLLEGPQQSRYRYLPSAGRRRPRLRVAAVGGRHQSPLVNPYYRAG